jgi:hypothetical protein
MKRLGIYVGLKEGTSTVFRSATTPTESSHGDQFSAVIGKFRTVRGAKCMTHYGNNNPHIQHVRDAERIGKQYANDLKPLPLTKKHY